MSGLIYEVHKCNTPASTSRIGHGSVWECDCGNKFELVISYDGYRSGWVYLPSKHWNEQEQRPLKQWERIALIKLPEPEPTKWQRFISRIKGEQK